MTQRPDTTSTFFSRDAGVTWKEIAKGSHIYDMGDHGGIIVMANDQEATNKILFSWNEGIDWEKLIISEKVISNLLLL